MKTSNPKGTSGAIPMADLSFFWNLAEEAVLASLHSSPIGLSESESRSRLSQFGAEAIEGRRRSSLSIIAAQLNNPIAASVAIVTFALPFSPMGQMFELVRPTFALLGLVAMIAFFYAVAMEVGKSIFYAQQEER